jgi:hypothetical protein
MQNTMEGTMQHMTVREDQAGNMGKSPNESNPRIKQAADGTVYFHCGGDYNRDTPYNDPSE